MPLDLTDEKSMVAAVERITADHGAVGVLINNAAYSLNGTIGETPLDQVRHQFETNFFGLSRMTQLVLPGMREQRSGRIIMMSSIFGLFATPGRGYYQATKHALEAISDSLRQEVRPWGIKVAIIEPSPILGSFVPTTVGDLDLGRNVELIRMRKHFQHSQGRVQTGIQHKRSFRVPPASIEKCAPSRKILCPFFQFANTIHQHVSGINTFFEAS